MMGFRKWLSDPTNLAIAFAMVLLFVSRLCPAIRYVFDQMLLHHLVLLEHKIEMRKLDIEEARIKSQLRTRDVVSEPYKQETAVSEKPAAPAAGDTLGSVSRRKVKREDKPLDVGAVPPPASRRKGKRGE